MVLLVILSPMACQMNTEPCPVTIKWLPFPWIILHLGLVIRWNSMTAFQSTEPIIKNIFLTLISEHFASTPTIGRFYQIVLGLFRLVSPGITWYSRCNAIELYLFIQIPVIGTAAVSTCPSACGKNLTGCEHKQRASQFLWNKKL